MGAELPNLLIKLFDFEDWQVAAVAFDLSASILHQGCAAPALFERSIATIAVKLAADASQVRVSALRFLKSFHVKSQRTNFVLSTLLTAASEAPTWEERFASVMTSRHIIADGLPGSFDAAHVLDALCHLLGDGNESVVKVTRQTIGYMFMRVGPGVAEAAKAALAGEAAENLAAHGEKISRYEELLRKKYEASAQRTPERQPRRHAKPHRTRAEHTPYTPNDPHIRTLQVAARAAAKSDVDEFGDTPLGSYVAPKNRAPVTPTLSMQESSDVVERMERRRRAFSTGAARRARRTSITPVTRPVTHIVNESAKAAPFRRRSIRRPDRYQHSRSLPNRPMQPISDVRLQRIPEMLAGEWNEQVEALELLSAASKEVPSPLLSAAFDLQHVLRAVVKLISSLRSRVSRAAAGTVGDLFAPQLAPYLEHLLEEAVKPLARVSAGSNKFLTRAADSSLKKIFESCKPSRLVGAILPLLTLRAPASRFRVAMLLSRALERSGEDLPSSPYMTRIFQSTIQLLGDANQGTRNAARRCLVVLRAHVPDVLHALRTYCSSEREMDKVAHLLDTLPPAIPPFSLSPAGPGPPRPSQALPLISHSSAAPGVVNER